MDASRRAMQLQPLMRKGFPVEWQRQRPLISSQ
jgi:hypothetical protein